VKIGILADIHANLPALEAVLARAETLKVEHLFILGVIVGYYYWPAECFEMIESWPHDIIGGNHEGMLSEIVEEAEKLLGIVSKYGHGIAVALSELAGDRLQRCIELPPKEHVTTAGRPVLLCHGTPNDRDEYVYPDAPITQRNLMSVADSEYVFFGHTHYPTNWQTEQSWIVHPASVGQPRNRVPGAHWALFDVVSGRVVPQREDYDLAKIVEECRRYDPDLPYLENVLKRT